MTGITFNLYVGLSQQWQDNDGKRTPRGANQN